MTAARIIEAAGAESCHPWPRHILTPSAWAAMATALGAAPTPPLLGLWADTAQVHALFLAHGDTQPILASVPLEAGGFAALSPARPGAAWFERLVHDLWGHVAHGGTDPRPWLDHGTWPHTAPLSPRPGPPAVEAPAPPEFAAPAQAGLSQLPVGPIQGNLDGAWHLRLSVCGETVLQAEARLGYAHKGVLSLMRGKSPRVAARFVARLSAETTVAHAYAFALAVEAALAVTAPPRAAGLRRVMLELERIAVHLDDLALIAGAVQAQSLAASCVEEREHLLRGLDAAFGHRLMMDCIVPGGLAADPGPRGMLAIRRALGRMADALPGLRRRMDTGPCLQRLAGVGRLLPEQVERLAVGGVSGRASGRRYDARLVRGERALTVPVETAGDAAARTRLRLAEIEASMPLLARLLDTMPDGEISVVLPMLSGEGIGCAESARGDVWHWLRLDHGQIATAFPRDPAWALWPAAELALQGAALQDAAAIRYSFGLTATGIDL